MDFKVEDLSGIKKAIHIEIPQDVVDSEIEAGFKDIRYKVKIKGFRQGKAPRNLIEKQYGADVMSDAASKIVNESLNKVVESIDHTILSIESIDTPAIEKNKPYKYTVKCEVKPVIEDIDFKGLKLEKKVAAAEEEDIEYQLKLHQDRLAKFNDASDDKQATEKDLANIGYEAFIDGQPCLAIEKTESLDCNIGGEPYLFSEDFTKEIIGMKKGDKKRFTVKLGEDFEDKKLSGKDIEFEVQLNGLKEKDLPEINDEFAKQFGDIKSLEELKDRIRKEITDNYTWHSEQDLNEQIFKALLEKVDLEAPQVFIERELEGIVRDFQNRAAMYGKTIEDIGTTIEQIKEKYRNIAEGQVKRSLILAKIAEQEKLEVSSDDLDKHFKEISEKYAIPLEKVKEDITKEKNVLENVKASLLEKKALELVKESAEITEKKIEKDSKEPAPEEKTESDKDQEAKEQKED